MSLPAAIVERFPGPEHARWGLGATMGLVNIPVNTIRNSGSSTQLIPNLIHPIYQKNMDDWKKWRLTFESGDDFIEEYCKQFSKRENADDFRARKAITPIPAFAKGEITEIKNAIFQRIADTARIGGPDSYQKSVVGNLGGVDKKGATMNWFIGHHVIPELLVMQRVGVYVDNEVQGPSLADKQDKHPYLYIYRAEDIRDWAYSPEGAGTEFQSLLLRDYNYVYESGTNLPTSQVESYRHLFLNADGFVEIHIYNDKGARVGGPTVLKIKKIPFVIFEITESLIKDVANHQIALMNLESADVSYTLKGNVPFYTEQFDPRNTSPNVRAAQKAYQQEVCDTSCGPEGTTTEQINVGPTEGRRYPIGAERPGFIAPSPDPLRVSMEKQKALKEDIRRLVHLALSNVQPKMASAESKSLDQQGLESGLSYIGLELERGERLIGDFWKLYENQNEPPTINYPKRWSLKSADEVKNEVNHWRELRDDLPSKTFKIEANVKIAETVLGNHVPAKILDTIAKEIRAAKTASSATKTLDFALKAGLLSQESAIEVMGHDPKEKELAAKEHAERQARILAAQGGPAARGVRDLDPNPDDSSRTEKQGKRQRGQGRN